MKQQDELKRLYWSTDKERIKHILSRVNIKYLHGLFEKLKDIQHHKIYDPIEDDIDYYDKVNFQEVNKINYVTSKVVCKYDGCIFEVSLKTIKDELKRRSEETQFECKRSIEDFNMEVEHAMDILADCIPYDDPNYWEYLRQTSEQYVKDCWDPNSELNKICGKHDEMLDEGLIDF